MNPIKLTEYSHGAGCGCKLPLSVLNSIIKSSRDTSDFPRLLVGNGSNDDAAAFDLGNGTSVLSTTDFFMPIVDDPYTFGRIAATNAISDIYAMGGTPLMAIAIFGWPVDKLPAEVASQVIDGGRATCLAAGIPLAGGHSIDSPEPIFGLAVTGIVDNKQLKRNNQAEPDCHIFITKPIGIGILTTAQKRKKIEDGHIEHAIDAMCTLNSVGKAFSSIEGVVALTDVTGFGLLGHLSEICEASKVSATVEFDKVPLLPNTRYYQAMGCVPGGTKKNFVSYGHHLSEMPEDYKDILCDAQTSGGLLAIVKEDALDQFLEAALEHGLELTSIGKTTEPKKPLITVI
ncbi:MULTISPECIES: selenide, water dikinase SelD [unclassified Fusibacter]|uniref:selenide, water dikinase SelD n=1 Tax=unclassified Fusibacter TaxID=2624464 RepID=UPI0010114551|nr:MULTISPECIES: selenide, water dikinase SelD [unclassified Fusibacter]MCK8059154.1 selenide, water dikinase SelD [Fusibacter sp. A2]NPE22563.1 selenide, water dikinase SelD [Fusibacter sp. A1]RXV60666.1 selenide, water dikinase SelD [Fusibacter sp. A1]